MEQWMRSQEDDWILQKNKRRVASDREISKQLGRPSKEGGQKRGRGVDSNIPPSMSRANRNNHKKQRKFKLVNVDWGNNIEGNKLNLNNLVENIEENTAGGRGVPDPLTTENGGTDQQEGRTNILEIREAAETPEIPDVDNIVDRTDGGLNIVDRGCENICENICRNICENENDTDTNIGNSVSRECNIVKKMCLEHGRGAILKKYKKRIWTKIKKTGLFGYRTVTSINWICPEAPTQPHLV